LLNFLKKMNQRSRKMNRPYKKLKIHFPRYEESFRILKMLKLT
jgi:hypothetical protein